MLPLVDAANHQHSMLPSLRNIGIVHYTDSYLLYNAVRTDSVSDVERGNTVTDYLDQERDRGITIIESIS